MIPQASADYYRDQRRITTMVLLAARKIWGTRPPKDFDAWFLANIGELFALVTAGQARAAETADSYVSDVLDELGTPVEPDVALSTAPLIGVSSDGRPLDSLIYGAVIHVKGQIAQADTVTDQVISSAWESGLNSLMLRMQVQVADTARASTAMSIASRRDVGYTRMLNPPSCPKCAALAGKFFRWNRGFSRHPGCDCRHIPTREDTARDVRTDPKEYFDSLSKAMQDKVFTNAGAEAIRAGADISQVVNVRRGMSTAQTNIGGWTPKGQLEPRTVYGQQVFTSNEGVTRRGLAYRAMSRAGYAQRQTDIRNGRYFQARSPRLMPETIFEIAEDRDDALRLLKLYGYLADESPRPRPGRGSRTTSNAPDAAPATASGSGGGRPPVPPTNRNDVPVADGDDNSGDRFKKVGYPSEYTLIQDANLLTDEERDGVVAYVQGEYLEINNALRGHTEMTEDVEVKARILREALSKYPLPHAVRTSRETEASDLGLSSATLSEELIGEFLQELGFMSTSGWKNPPKIVDRQDPIILDILVEQGTPALMITEQIHPIGQIEREVLLIDARELFVFGVFFDEELGLWRIQAGVVA